MDTLSGSKSLSLGIVWVTVARFPIPIFHFAEPPTDDEKHVSNLTSPGNVMLMNIVTGWTKDIVTGWTKDY
jgi:hypothetical protein